jgi:hypothetical protein
MLKSMEVLEKLCHSLHASVVVLSGSVAIGDSHLEQNGVQLEEEGVKETQEMRLTYVRLPLGS